MMRNIFLIALMLVGLTMVAQAADLHKGGTPADVAAIKKAVAATRPEGTISDWFIAIEGNDAVAGWAMGPGAGGSDGVVKANGKWIVTCQSSAKGQFGSCKMPTATYKRLQNETDHLMEHQ